jgi:hypothetical protein
MRKLKRLLMLAGMALTAAAFIQQLNKPVDERDWHGEILGVPYDFRPLTITRIRERWWNPEDGRLFTPHTFGVGWSVNLYRLQAMLTGPARGHGDG